MVLFPPFKPASGYFYVLRNERLLNRCPNSKTQAPKVISSNTEQLGGQHDHAVANFYFLFLGHWT